MCRVSRYKVKDGKESCDDEITKDTPTKVLCYIPIITIVKWLFANAKDAKNIRWHVDEKKRDGKISHHIFFLVHY